MTPSEQQSMKTKVKAQQSNRKVKVKAKAIADLDESEAREELRRLNDEIEKHDEAYYELDSPLISDAAYDKLVRRAEDLEGKFSSLRGIVKHLERVGSGRGGGGAAFGPFVHSKPLLSLDNALNIDELDKFLTRCSTKLQPAGQSSSIEYVVEPKIDGLSLALHYRKGQLAGAGTRGDGKVGDDVTVNVNLMANVPQRIAVDEEEVEVRGEVYISTLDFAALNDARRAANESQFATPRNAAAGSLRQLDSSLVKERNIKFFAYEIRGLAKVTSQTETLQSLQSLGFSVATPWAKFELPADLGSLREHVVAMGDEKQRSQRGFDTDGVVVKINRFELRETLGQLSRYPNWAVAYKFPASEAETTLEGITVQVGRTGVLTPVAILQRVLVGGVFVERATLHNEEEVRRLKLRPGLTVRVKRSGDVIPKIVGVGGQPSESSTAATESDYALPCSCPVCGSPTEREEGGVLVRCTGGVACSAQAIEQNRHFCSRDAADIEGFGAATAEDLYELGIVKTPADIFKLRKIDQSSAALNVEGDGEGGEKMKPRLRGSKGWGDRSVNNLLAAIDNRRTLPLHRFIYALGVRHVGQETAKDLASKFRTFSALWSSLLRGDEGSDELLSINGIGPKAVSALLQLAKDERSRAIVQDLLSEMTILDDAGVQEADKASTFDPAAPSLQGQTVVFTGKFKLFLRKKAEELSVERGATIGKSITRQTTLLVEAASSAEGGVLSTKAKKARSSGVYVITEQDFANMFQLPGGETSGHSATDVA